jgi:hypothetical protein
MEKKKENLIEILGLSIDTVVIMVNVIGVTIIDCIKEEKKSRNVR